MEKKEINNFLVQYLAKLKNDLEVSNKIFIKGRNDFNLGLIDNMELVKLQNKKRLSYLKTMIVFNLLDLEKNSKTNIIKNYEELICRISALLNSEGENEKI